MYVLVILILGRALTKFLEILETTLKLTQKYEQCYSQ